MVRHYGLLAVPLLALSVSLVNGSSGDASSAIERRKLGSTNADPYARHSGHPAQNDQPTNPLICTTPTHHHSGAPLTTLNESRILLTHSPDPLAYYELDGMDGGKPSVLVAHVVFMGLAFFVLLPLALFLKNGKSQLVLIPQGAFLVTSLLGMLFGAIYGSLTPDLYENNVHSILGWIVMALVLALNAYDLVGFAARFKRWCLGGTYSEPTKTAQSAHKEAEDDDDDDDEVPLVHSPVDPTEVHWTHLPSPADSSHRRNDSLNSDDTLFDSAGPESTLPESRESARARLLADAKVGRGLLEKSLLLLAWIELLSGIAVYSGSCRERYLNGCLAHTIKGSIFLWYGLITFARYLGAFSALGWAWNRRSLPHGVSAEFVESCIIFFYGISNTWLERLGKGDSPWTHKDWEHTSIAVMFWFAGALGMLLESRKLRFWISQSALEASAAKEQTELTQLPSWSSGFNPFPAFVIGAVGIGMSVHQQTYRFQTDIHALWGTLLALFATFRLLTYFFHFLRPPTSVLPSRPPTEALAAMCVTGGGAVFILSTEQMTFAAMRHGFDNKMAFLNITVALVSLWFSWTLALFALRGWALARNRPEQREVSSRKESCEA